MTVDRVLDVALLQLNSGDDPAANLTPTVALLRQAARAGARLVMTPEVTNLVSSDRVWQDQILRREQDDPTLAALRAEARDAGIWLLIGSLALKSDDPVDDRFVNRSFLIDPQGEVVARYDKLHMFDVAISESEPYRESAAYRPGDRAVLSRVEDTGIGLTICYDLRFPHLYRSLAEAGAGMLAVPSAFSPVTGQAHWEILLRARAIENGCFVLAPAQCSTHAALHSSHRRPRRSHGHSLAVDPWGKVLADGGTEPGMTLVRIDLALVDEARSRIPSLTHDRPFAGP